MEEFEKGTDEENCDEIEVIEGDEGETFVGILKRFLLTPIKDKHSQRVIFRAKCTINEKVFDIIVDIRSNENFVLKSGESYRVTY